MVHTAFQVIRLLVGVLREWPNVAPGRSNARWGYASEADVEDLRLAMKQSRDDGRLR